MMSDAKTRQTIVSKGLRGEMIPAPDKSISHRALIFSSLAQGKSTIRNLLLGEDVLRTLTIIRQLGVKTSHDAQSIKDGDELIVDGVGLHGFSAPSDILYCGNSGTTMRLMLGVLAGQNFPSVLTGDASLNKRPMQRVYTPLGQMGAVFQEEVSDGKRLVHVRGQQDLKGARIDLPVASAQVKSAVLLAGLLAKGETCVSEPFPSRNHTELLLRSIGGDLTSVDAKTVRLKPVESLKSFEIEVPGDISSAAFFMVASLITPGSDLVIRDVCLNPTRTGLLDALIAMGGDITILSEREQGGEIVGDVRFKFSQLRNIDIGGNMIPRLIDEIPILALAATQSTGVMRITGAKELRVKESDRVSTVAQTLSAFGAKVEELEDGLVITGKTDLHAPDRDIQTFDDHRIAMMAMIAGLVIPETFCIQGTDSVQTSFPHFFNLLASVNVK